MDESNLSAQGICAIIREGSKAGVIKITVGSVVIDFVPTFEPPPRNAISTTAASEASEEILEEFKKQHLDLTDPLAYERLVFEGEG